MPQSGYICVDVCFFMDEDSETTALGMTDKGGASLTPRTDDHRLLHCQSKPESLIAPDERRLGGLEAIQRFVNGGDCDDEPTSRSASAFLE